MWTLLILFGSGVAAGPLAEAASPKVYRDHVEPHWIGGGNQFWYRNDLPDRKHEFVRIDATDGSRLPAFDHVAVAARLSEKLHREVSPDRLPVESLQFDDDGRIDLIGEEDASWRLDPKTGELTELPKRTTTLDALRGPMPSRAGGKPTRIRFDNQSDGEVTVFWIDTELQKHIYASIAAGESWASETYVGHVWLVDDAQHRQLGVYRATATPAVAVIGRGGPTTKPSGSQVPPDSAKPRKSQRADAGEPARRSPDGRWTLSRRDNNLYLRESEDAAQALSTDGKPGDDYDTRRAWWSPDSKYVVAMRVEAATERQIVTVESSPADQVQPKVRTLNYPKPGDPIDHPRLRLFSVSDRKLIPVSDDLWPNPWRLSEVRWAADSSRFTFVYNQRGHQALRVLAVQAATGAVRTIVDESSKTFIDYSGKYFCHWLGDDQLVWMSERDGWNHLWLYDAVEGKVLNAITHGNWAVQDVIRIDPDRREVLFNAGGVRPGQDPYYANACRASLDGKSLTVLTEGDGTHDVQFSPDGRYLVDRWSRVDQPPVTELRDALDGHRICPLETADASEVLKSRGGRWPERFVAPGRDGTTEIYGVIHLPHDFDPNRKYPVIENIYAGPQTFSTPKAFRSRYGPAQQIADLGAIVVQCDGMGTSGRSKAFHDVCWKKLNDAGFLDRIAWIKSAAKKVPQMDLSRVGIFGGSAGGQNAMAALLWHHDFYRVAVADCGCHDNRMDKIWWNEQWMGWPVDESYAESSNVVNAKLLEGRLLLIVGEMDDNVDPASTMQVVNALEKANKDFDLVVVTGAHHGAAETPYGSRRRAAFLKKHLID